MQITPCRASSHIAGDTFDLCVATPTAVEAVRPLDANGHRYELTTQRDPQATYDVFRAEDSFPVLGDAGADADFIAEVQRDCRHVATVAEPSAARQDLLAPEQVVGVVHHLLALQ